MTRPRLLPSDPDFVFNPLSPEYDRDPYPILADLREHAPIFEIKEMGALFLSRHKEVVEVLSDEARFSPDRTRWEHYAPPPPEQKTFFLSPFFAPVDDVFSRPRRMFVFATSFFVILFWTVIFYELN